MDELLALVGRNWRLLLLYPGGLTTLGALLAVVFASRTRPTFSIFQRISVHDLPVCAMWLLVCALLPLPQTSWPYSLDLAALLLLIEASFWLRMLSSATLNDAPMLGAILSMYPLLLLAVVIIGTATGSLVLREIAANTDWLRWVGVGVWALALPPLLALGPWRSTNMSAWHPLRQVTHMGLLLAAALPTNDTTSRLASLAGFCVMLLALAALDHWWQGDADRWLRWQPWLVMVLALLVAALSTQGLIARLR